MRNKYDVIVIGGGSAGFSVLEQISHRGLKIGLVENRKLGGSRLRHLSDPIEVNLF